MGVNLKTVAMKTILLLTLTALFFEFSALAQMSIELDKKSNKNNYYGPVPDSIVDKNYSDYTAMKGDLVTISVEGKLPYYTKSMIVQLFDKSTGSEWVSLGLSVECVKDSVFDFTTDVYLSKSSSGAGSDYLEVYIEVAGDSIPASESVMLTDATISIDAIVEAQENVTYLTGNWCDSESDKLYKECSGFNELLDTEPLLEKGDTVVFSISAMSDTDISYLDVTLYDNSKAANYWKRVADFVILEDETIPANTNFTYSVEILVTEEILATDPAEVNITLWGIASKTAKITINSADATVLKKDQDPKTAIEENLDDVITIKVYSITGTYIKEISSIDELSRGVYILEIERGNGFYEVIKYAKK